MEEAIQINQLKGGIKECDTDKPYIFISYSKKDSLHVYPLIIKLQELGYNIWIDTRGLETSVGRNWQDPALNSLADSNCKAVFFMISSNSLKSAPVFAEIMWSQDSRPVIRNHEGKSLTLKIVDTDSEYNLADGRIKSTVDNIISADKTPLVAPTDYDTMAYVTVIDKDLYTPGINQIKTKGDLAFEFYDCLFEKKLGGGGNVTLANYNDIDTIIKNIPPECKCIEAHSEVRAEPAPKETSAPAAQAADLVRAEPDTENSANEKTKTRSASIGNITYTIYGKEYTHNQTDMMLNVFAKVLKQHLDAVDKILADPEKPLMRCASAINYELRENKTASTPTRYYTGCYFNIGRGIFIGTGLNYQEKLRNISQLLTICEEDFSILQSDQIELPAVVKTKASGRGSSVKRSFLDD